jgi:hypothetical protein
MVGARRVAHAVVKFLNELTRHGTTCAGRVLRYIRRVGDACFTSSDGTPSKLYAKQPVRFTTTTAEQALVSFGPSLVRRRKRPVPCVPLLLRPQVHLNS